MSDTQFWLLVKDILFPVKHTYTDLHMGDMPFYFQVFSQLDKLVLFVGSRREILEFVFHRGEKTQESYSGKLKEGSVYHMKVLVILEHNYLAAGEHSHIHSM